MCIEASGGAKAMKGQMKAAVYVRDDFILPEWKNRGYMIIN